jgi:hypothetical protein
MTYQLPNGNVIEMSISEFLSLSDIELNDLINEIEGDNPYEFNIDAGED